MQGEHGRIMRKKGCIFAPTEKRGAFLHPVKKGVRFCTQLKKGAKVKRSVNFDSRSLQIIEQYQQKHSCSFNKAVCDIITKFPEAVNRVNRMNRELEVAQDIQGKVEAIFQWVERGKTQS